MNVIVCETCNGTGSETCENCSGSGHSGNDVCPICDGENREICNTCWGSGYLELPNDHEDENQYRSWNKNEWN